MSQIKTHVKKGDEVEVISGAHRGAQGKVLHVLTKNNRLIIEGVNFIKKHEKKSQDRPQGEIVEREGSIHISNVKKIGSTEPKK